jgi:hypothetical protein
MRSDLPDDPDCGVCGADVPPLVGERLTGSGLTLAEAARALERGQPPALTALQRELVERWAEERALR